MPFEIEAPSKETQSAAESMLFASTGLKAWKLLGVDLVYSCCRTGEL